MSSTASSVKAPVLLDLYKPAILPSPGPRLQVLLRRANDHRAAIDKKISELVPGSHKIIRWQRQNEQFVFDKKWRFKVCLDQLEDFVRANSETSIKSEVKMLRVQWQFFNQVLRFMPSSNVVCTDPERQAKL